MNLKLHAGALVAFALLASPVVAKVQPTPAVQATEHQRLLPLQGGQNFRDLGGYRTADGRTVRWNLIYRSGAMNQLTAADFDYLAKLGLRTVCDFRDNRERTTAPVNWPDGSAPKVFADDYSMDMSAMGGLFSGGPITGDSARKAMATTYPQLLANFNGQYRRMFQELLNGDAPLAFNCSAGKDRTGVAAALILTALGVPRETVIEDYLLSNVYFDPSRAMQPNDPSAQMFKQLPPDAIKALMGVDRSYIDAVFAVIDAHSGGVEGYLKDELGLSSADIKKLKKLYTA